MGGSPPGVARRDFGGRRGPAPRGITRGSVSRWALRLSGHVLAIAAQGRGDDRNAIVLLQRVLVLAIGNDLSSGTAKGKPASTQAPTLTLSLDLPEAQMLSLAAQRGPLAVALRNPNDQRVTDNPATFDSSELDDPVVREQVGAVRHGSGIARVPSKL